MTDDAFTAAGHVSASLADEINRALEVAAGARKQAVEQGVHEHHADGIYLSVFQATVNELHAAQITRSERRTRDWPFMLIVNVAITVCSFALACAGAVYNRPWILLGWSVTAVVWATATVCEFRRWRRA